MLKDKYLEFIQCLIRSTECGKTTWSKEKKHCCAYTAQLDPGYFIRLSAFKSNQAEITKQCFELGISYKDNDTVNTVVFCQDDQADVRFERIGQLYGMVKS